MFGHGDDPIRPGIGAPLIVQPGVHGMAISNGRSRGGKNLGNALPDQLSPEAEGFDGEVDW